MFNERCMRDERIENLINIYRNMKKYESPDSNDPVFLKIRDELEERISYKIKGVHRNHIGYSPSIGCYRTRNPRVTRKDKIELMIIIYEYHFLGLPVIKRQRCYLKAIYYEWIKEFDKLVHQKHRGIGSLRHYISDYKNYLEGTELENTFISEITYKDLRNYYATITEGQAVTRKTLNNVKAMINQIFDYARNQNIPVINTREVRTSDLCCKEYDNYDDIYSDEEREAVLKVCLGENEVYARCIGLMFCLCVRVGEIKALKWSDVNISEKKVYIHRSMVQILENGTYKDACVDRTKGKKRECNRYENLSDTAIKLLEEQLIENPSGEFVFMVNDHPLLSNIINRRLEKICKKAGVRYLSTHKIRYWAVTSMYEANVPEALIQYTAGHTNPSTTNHYKRLAKKKNDIDHNTWNSIFG